MPVNAIETRQEVTGILQPIFLFHAFDFMLPLFSVRTRRPAPRQVDRHRPADQSRSENRDFHFHSLTHARKTESLCPVTTRDCPESLNLSPRSWMQEGYITAALVETLIASLLRACTARDGSRLQR